MWSWRWYRFEGVTVGEESGHVGRLPFVRFRHEREAVRWVQRVNSGDEFTGVHYEYRVIEKRAR